MFAGAVADILIGIGIAMRRTARPALWAALAISVFWARVGGDLLDLAILALADGGYRRRRASAAAAVVTGALLLDLMFAKALSDEKHLPRQPMKDYRDRSGLPQGAAASRGLAAPDAQHGTEANRSPAA